MKFSAKNIGVDTGTIMVADYDYLNQVDKKADPFDKTHNGQDTIGKVFHIPDHPGWYNVSWYIGETYNGTIEGTNKLYLKSNMIFVCDPCYLIGKTNESWISYLTITKFMKNLNSDQVFIIDGMGGDGSYDVELSFCRTLNF